MKSFHLTIVATSLFLCSCGDPHEENLSRLAPEESADLIVVGISPSYTEVQGAAVLVAFSKLLARTKLGSTTVVVDALNCRRVAEFSVPADNPAFASEKARGQIFSEELLKLRGFINGNSETSDHLAPLHVPRFLEMVTEIDSRMGGKTSVLLVGSALHQDPEGNWTFKELHYPSDGVLSASPLQNQLGTVGKEDFLTGIDLHFICLDDWKSDAYRLAVHRFWHLYCQRQQEDAVGLITFSPSLEDGVQRLLTPGLTPLWKFETDDKSTSREMVRIPSQLPDVPEEPLAVVETPEPEDEEPQTIVEQTLPPEGLTRLGLRWTDTVDLDLYVQTPGGSELFYDHRTGEDAFFYKDERNAPENSRGLEYVSFPNPVDPRQVKVWVNFYRGSLPQSPTADLVFEFHGKWYALPVKIESLEGNRGEDRQSDRSGRHWFGPIELKLPGP